MSARGPIHLFIYLIFSPLLVLKLSALLHTPVCFPNANRANFTHSRLRVVRRGWVTHETRFFLLRHADKNGCWQEVRETQCCFYSLAELRHPFFFKNLPRHGIIQEPRYEVGADISAGMIATFQSFPGLEWGVKPLIKIKSELQILGWGILVLVLKSVCSGPVKDFHLSDCSFPRLNDSPMSHLSHDQQDPKEHEVKIEERDIYLTEESADTAPSWIKAILRIELAEFLPSYTYFNVIFCA